MAVNTRDWCNHLLVNLHCLYWFFLLTARQNVSGSQENTWLSVRRLENYQPFTSAFNFANTPCRLHTATDTFGSKYTIKFLLFSLENWYLTPTSMCYLHNFFKAHLKVLHRNKCWPSRLHYIPSRKSRDYPSASYYATPWYRDYR